MRTASLHLQDKRFSIVACIPKVLPYAEHKDVNTLHAWPGTPLYEPHSSLQSIPLECDLPSKAITFSHTLSPRLSDDEYTRHAPAICHCQSCMQIKGRIP